MIYIEWEESENPARVTYQHFKPQLVPEEQKQRGLVIEALPEPTAHIGKIEVLYINPESKELWYEYIDLPEEIRPIEEKIEQLETENIALQIALAETIEKQEMDKINNQIALAELVETLIIKGVL